MAKQCDICSKEIPADFINNLCWDCYNKQTGKKVEIKTKLPEVPFDLKVIKNGITEPNYVENPEADDKEQWLTNLHLFERHGCIIWKPTRQIYTYIKDYCLTKITEHPQYPKFIWRPKIVDVGCGNGAGANILSQEADFVWGIDKNERSIKFAKECFERIKNQIYYSSQVSFDCLDIFEDTRETMKFDIVTCVEIIEHVNDYKRFLRLIIDKFARKIEGSIYDVLNPTEFFISTPNRANKRIMSNTPGNKYHVREWNAMEFYNVLSEFFNNIVFHNALGIEIPYEQIATTTHTPILVKAWNPK